MTALRNTPTMLHSIDEHGRIAEVSDLWLATLGYTWEEVIGRPSTDFLSEASARYAREVVLPMFFETGACEVEYEMRRKDGTLIPVRLRGVAVRNERGTFLRSIAVVEDLTQQRALEQKMFEAQKLEVLGLMAGNIAHDYNNLLASVVGNAQLASRHAAHHPVASRSLDNIMVAAARATDLCRQLLAYSGRGKFEIEVIDLDALVTEMSEVLAVNVGESTSIELELAGHAKVEVDATQIRQILMNLVINAGEALGDTGGTITIRTNVVDLDATAIAQTARPDAHPARYLELAVTDTGPGMAPDVLAHIFDPFFTTKASGRGLGLAAVHGIVRGHQGTLQVTSELGRGTGFHIYLPVHEEPVAQPPEPDRTASRGTVAVVDDDELLRSTLATQLSDAGYAVVLAGTAREAIALATNRPTEVATFLVDVTMPGADGSKLAHELRAAAPAATIVLMSGYSSNVPSAPANTRFLAKPFSERELLRAVEPPR